MNPKKSRAVHLDTHVVCWLYAGLAHQLSEAARSFIEDNDIAISPWVLSELQALHERGIIHVGATDIFEDLERRIGLQLAPADAAALIKNSLSLSWARDTFDRMIVAHARLLEVPLVSKDAHLHTHFSQVVW